MKGRRAAAERQHALVAWLAWHVGLLVGLGQNAPKKYPKLEALIGKPKPALARQPETEMNANLRAWAFFLRSAKRC